MKKVLFLLTVLALLAMLALPAFAAFATGTASISAADSVEIGEPITVTVALTGATDIRGLTVEPTFDPDIFELTAGEWLLTGATIAEFSVAEGNGVIGYAAVTNVSGNILTFTLKAKETLTSADLGNSSVACNLKVNDGSVTHNLSAAAITVEVYCDHDFTGEVTEEAYLDAAASCTAKATYFYSCPICGPADDETFETGEKLPHTFTKQDTAEKYRKSPATCTALAVYHMSCVDCGEKDPDNTFTAGELAPCSFTREEPSDTYLATPATCTELATYYYACANTECTEIGEEPYKYGELLPHEEDVPATCTTQAICLNCGNPYGDKLPHNFTEKVMEDKYIQEPANCVAPAVYYYSCSCGTFGTMTFEGTELGECDFSGEVAEEKYLKTAGSCTEKAVYYYSCIYCFEKGYDTFKEDKEPAHTYSATFSTNEESHWYACTVCGDKKDLADHTPGAAATETTPQICTVCEYVIEPELGHQHKYSETWTTDGENHWHVCSCGKTADSAAHTWDEGTVTVEPTTEAVGEKTFTCTVCEATKTEEIEKLPPVTTEEVTEEVTEPETTEKVTEKVTEEVTEPETTEEVPEEDGCDATIGASALLLVMAMIAPAGIMLKKKD